MLLRFIEGAASNSGQRPENVNQTHQVLASGILVLQKNVAKEVLIETQQIIKWV